MAELRPSGRVILMTLVFLLLGGAYYVAGHFSDAPSEDSEKSGAVRKVVQSTSADADHRMEDRQSDTNPNLEVPTDRDRAYIFSESKPEAGLDALEPAELYARYLNEANDGNLNAQYVLVTALDECRHGPATTDEIAELERSGLSHDVVQAANDRFRRCEPLYKELPDLEKEYQQRYEVARNAKHPLILVKQRKLPLEEKRRLLIDAISQTYPEPSLYAAAYMEAATLHREYPEKLDILREEAWLLLYCEASLHCDSQKEFEYLRTEKYHDHELDEIVANYSSITTALEQRDWDALGL